jgi:hypothetical protein
VSEAAPLQDPGPRRPPLSEESRRRLEEKAARLAHDPRNKRRLRWIRKGFADGSLLERPPE